MFPVSRGKAYLDSILYEIKGSEIRKNVCSSSRNLRRHAFKFLDDSVGLLERYDARIVGRAWIKGIGQPFDGRAVYTFSVQSMFKSFQTYLTETDEIGIITADHRTHSLNRNVSHSIFTQKFKHSGDDYHRIVDLPTFAISDNHAGLQLCDVVCSSLLFPMSVHAYCTGRVANLHVRPGYRGIRDRYAARLKALQYRFADPTGRRRGGITVSDALARRNGALLFR